MCVKLPPAQPMASIDAEVAKRCFIVCGPPVPPIYAMKDAFCRFGNLIDVYMLPGKNCGYAKYASVESANEAIEVDHASYLVSFPLCYEEIYNVISLRCYTGRRSAGPA